MGIDPQPGWISGGDKPKEPRFNDPKRGKRLQTVMADAGVASRRACETLIEEGAVEVNGITVRTLPVFVDPAQDRILVNGEPIRRKLWSTSCCGNQRAWSAPMPTRRATTGD